MLVSLLVLKKMLRACHGYVPTVSLQVTIGLLNTVLQSQPAFKASGRPITLEPATNSHTQPTTQLALLGPELQPLLEAHMPDLLKG
jgi:hypothetical protein